jgi:hypothetical protein
MSGWIVVETPKGHIIMPVVDKKCPFCGKIMLLHRFHVFDQVTQGFKHCDVDMKCPNCSFFCKFGVAVNEYEYAVLKDSPLHAKVLREELLELELVDEEFKEKIERRLKALGYW